ncbi:MAG: 2,3-diphosphoglycerate-dependent phosphoglycerate mutase [Planctomycetes bacterium]|nr:2,3-diphosphoglycerate-dependent phosphoglycerate mutase [Planctomycetota bacterium]
MMELVLLRHGQSAWNLENRFTGWIDVDLSQQGLREAARAGELLKAGGYSFDAAYTSRLKRAIRTLWIALDALDQLWIPVEHEWVLNERHYGALQGLNKAESVRAHGEATVLAWRRSFSTPPPPLRSDDPSHPRFDPRYADVNPQLLPSTESLKETCARVIPFYESVIVPQLRAGKKLIIAAHGNSLRALLMHLDGLSEAEITGINIPTGFPLVYSFDATLRATGRRYLGDEAEVRAAIDGVASQTKQK